MTVKQVIVMRKDLNMRKGKMIAQGAHASIAFLTRKLQDQEWGHPADEYGLHHYSGIVLDGPQKEWIEGRFTKICVSVDSEQELHDIAAAAKAAGVVCSLIQDAGLTEFSEPTYTCLALGPDEADKIDPITGDLPLL